MTLYVVLNDRSLVTGFWILVAGFWLLVAGINLSAMLDIRFLILDMIVRKFRLSSSIENPVSNISPTGTEQQVPGTSNQSPETINQDLLD